MGWVVGFASGGEGEGVFGRGLWCMAAGCWTVEIMGRTLLRFS